MLDGIGRGKKQKEPVVPLKSKIKIPPPDKKRFIDSFRIRKTQKIKVGGNQSSIDKVKVNKSAKWTKRRKRFAFALTTVCFIVLFLCGLFSQSNSYEALVLLSRIKNESIILGFQNSAELRPTGGFWGSFAILKAKNNILDSEILFETNPYKNDNPLLRTSTSQLPHPMKETWPDRPQSFVNANWSLDFEEAGKTLEYYFGQGWDQQTDGAIGISSLAIIDLLRLTGPVTANDSTIVSADSFTQTMSQKIDTEYWQSEENKAINEPKTIIKEIAPEIISRAKALPKIKLYKFALDQASKGHIVVYFNDPKKQNIAENIGISGKLEPYKNDYLYVNNANLNGGKSSLNINQKIVYSVSEESGSYLGNLILTRSCPTNEWPNILNRNYTRVAVPLGSKLISAQLDDQDISNSIETLDESGRTTFGFWFSVGPTESKSAKITYSLPFQNLKKYNLVFQKQPGTLADEAEIDAFGQNIFSGLFDQNIARF